MKNGLTFRLLGIDAPKKGAEVSKSPKAALSKLVSDKELSIEYDTYQDDKFGRVLGYVWVPCNEGLIALCHENKALVNEVMVKKRVRGARCLFKTQKNSNTIRFFKVAYLISRLLVEIKLNQRANPFNFLYLVKIFCQTSKHLFCSYMHKRQ